MSNFPIVVQILPESIFPRRPKVVAGPPDFLDRPHIPPACRHWGLPQISRGMRGWLFRWIRYNRVKWMAEEAARRSIDWLRASGAAVLAPMSGEPLRRAQSLPRVVYQAARNGLFVYLPAMGRLLPPGMLADAGVATVKLSVDSYDGKPSLPKALVPIQRWFDDLVKKQYRYGYTVFFNVNICRNDLEHVKQLAEIAHDNGIATDYHGNESPLVAPDEHLKYRENNETYIHERDRAEISELLDWIIDKNRAGYNVVDSVQRLTEMKNFVRGEHERWSGRAGQSLLIIGVDGTLARCFPMDSASQDWSRAGEPKVGREQLSEVGSSRELNCVFKLPHILALCYDEARDIRYMPKQAKRGFQGVTGSVE